MCKIAAVALLLGGCSLVPGGAQYQAAIDAGTDAAVRDVQHFTDRAAWVYSQGMCAVTVGAYARMSDGAIKTGIGLICGLIDLDDLRPLPAALPPVEAPIPPTE